MDALKIITRFSDGPYGCRDCSYLMGHRSNCQLNALIEALRSGSLVVVDEQTAKLGVWAKNALPVETPFNKEQV